MMPGMNGWAFRAEQRADPSLAHIPVVVVTARPSLEVAGWPPLDGVQVLRKPFRMEALVEILDQHCTSV